MGGPCPDPVMSQLNPSRHVGAMPELLTDKLNSFIRYYPKFDDDIDVKR